MARFFQVLLVAAVAAIALAQDGTNYNAGDSGRSETIGPDGEVRGQYSYMDPNGKLITVKYTAGKNGFQVEGDHLPKAPQAPAAQAPQQQQPAYNPQQQQQLFNNFPQQQQQPQYYNNPAPAQSNFFQQQQPNFGFPPQQQQQQQQQYQPQPNFGFQPQQQQQQQPQIPIPQLPQLSQQGAPAPHPNALPGTGFNPFQFGPQQQQQQQPQQYYNPNQYNNNNNNGNRPVKVSVSQQPGAGFTYNIES